MPKTKKITYKKGDRVTVNFGKNYYRAKDKELICTGVVSGYNEESEEYTVKIDGGTIVPVKEERMERGLI